MLNSAQRENSVPLHPWITAVGGHAVAIGASEAIFNNTGDLYYKLIIEIKTRISEEIRAFVI